ncbi:small ribosomal subunit protein bS18m [Diabrotica undecimpunctata]|uniref:small ribosomal subunit protein bS18m n=1 Tax=Diabrotica undecimpunctata TaxID=50387 RepID=UPI003B632AD0
MNVFRRFSSHILKNRYGFVRSSSTNVDAPDFEMENPYEKEKVQCILCKHKIEPDYKNVRLLSQFQSPYTGRIYGRHITGLCKRQQQKVEKEIVKAQFAGLMAYYLKEPVFLQDPELFDVEKPIRPHRF